MATIKTVALKELAYTPVLCDWQKKDYSGYFKKGAFLSLNSLPLLFSGLPMMPLFLPVFINHKV